MNKQFFVVFYLHQSLFLGLDGGWKRGFLCVPLRPAISVCGDDFDRAGTA